MNYLTIFIIIVAVILAVTRVILSFLEERDRSNGFIINPDEYKMSGIMKIMRQERKDERKRRKEERRRARLAKKEEKK